MRKTVCEAERAVRRIAADVWDHQAVWGGEEGGAYAVRIDATVPPLRGTVSVLRVSHAKPGVAWRMAERRLRRLAVERAMADDAKAGEHEARAALLRRHAAAIRAALGGPALTPPGPPPTHRVRRGTRRGPAGTSAPA